MAILALVASIAIPAYRDGIEATQVAEAMVEIRRLEMQVERYFQVNGFFPETLAELDLQDTLDPWGNPYQYLRLRKPSPASSERAAANAAAAAARAAREGSGDRETAGADAGDEPTAEAGGDAGGGRGRGSGGGSAGAGGSSGGGGGGGGGGADGGSRGQARKDHDLVPINTDFDLYSQGPDGRSAPPLTAAMSRDDIVRANNGRYIGEAEGY